MLHNSTGTPRTGMQFCSRLNKDKTPLRQSDAGTKDGVNLYKAECGKSRRTTLDDGTVAV